VSATGAVTGRLPAHAELERWYRRLLRAYPMAYRRAHGDEILATLMDSAEPGRRRPSWADAADLTRGALRQWFRLPVGLSSVVAAVLATLVLGAVGAASGSFLAWQTAADLPSNAAAGQIGTILAGSPVVASAVDRQEGPRAIWPGVNLTEADIASLPDWTLEAAQARLRNDGWTPGRVQQFDPGAYSGDQRLDGVYQVFEATRDGQIVTGYATTITTPGFAGTHLSLQIHPAEPATVPVATALGWLVGAVTGWLLTGWAGYRLRRRELPRRLAALALGLTALGLAAHPTIGLYNSLRRLAFIDNGIYGHTPAYYWVVATPAAWLVTGTLVAGIGILVLAATARRRPAVQPAPAT